VEGPQRSLTYSLVPEKNIYSAERERERERRRGAQKRLVFWNVALKFEHMGTRLSILGFLPVL
jgi:hypothetical protein